MKIIEKGLYSMHDYYRESGEAAKEIEKYEQNLPEKKEKQIITNQTKEIPKISKQIEEEKQAFSLPFSEITEVVDESPSYIAGSLLTR